MEIKGPIGRFLAFALRVWSTPVLRFGLRGEQFHVELLPGLRETSSIDERLAQIDDARANLMAALAAVDELKGTAERNKEELRQALERVEQLRADRSAAEKELQDMNTIAKTDIKVFKKLAGIPSRSQIGWERLIGFIIGVAASLIAALIWKALGQ
jgi:ABC-type transporter Mla subunit MlaD